jgi:hypothetical protein
MNQERSNSTPEAISDASKTFAEICEETRNTVEEAMKRLNAAAIPEIKRCVADLDSTELARAYYHLRRCLEGGDGQRDVVGKTFERLKTEDYPNLLERLGLKNVPLTDLRKVIGTSARTFVQMVNKAVCLRYLKTYSEVDKHTGEKVFPYRHLVKEDANVQTLASVAKEMKAAKNMIFPEEIESEGEDVPAFKTGSKTTTTMRAL